MKEITNMPYIYKGARVTLLAASAISSTTGFLQTRDILGRVDETFFKVPFSNADGVDGSVILAQNPHFNSKSEPVDERAWIFQEQLLSPRLLIFGSERIWWSCFTTSRADSGQNDVQNSRIGRIRQLFSTSLQESTSQTNLEALNTRWEAIVEEYTQRKRAMPEDMLPAISGVAEDYQRSLEFETPKRFVYLAGMWKHMFPYNLLWVNDKSRDYEMSRLSLLKRPSKYRAPSWSWASIDDPVKFWKSRWIIKDQSCFPALITEGVDLVSNLAPHGEVKSGSISMRSRARQLILQVSQITQEI
jgi:hypothetical protein